MSASNLRDGGLDAGPGPEPGPDDGVGAAWPGTGGRLSRALRSTFLSLRNRNFKLYFFGQLVSNTGNWLTAVALTLLVLDITRSGLAVGILSAFQFGPILVFSPWAGAIADRVDKRRTLLLTQSLQMTQSVGLAILAFRPHPPLAGLYALAGAGGVLLSFDNPLRRSFVTEMVRAEDIPNAVVLYSTTVNFSRIFGPALAGLLVVTLGYGWGFTIDAVSYIAVLVCLWMMRPEELRRGPRKARSHGEVREGLRYVRSMPVLWISFATLTAIGILSYNFNVTLPLLVTRALHSTEGAFTVLYSIFSLGAVVSALIVARRGLVRIEHVVLGAAALGVSMLLLGIVPGVGTAVPAVFLVGLASVLYMTATTAIVQIESRPEMHGRVLALQLVILIGTAPLGGPFLGWLADTFGSRSPILLGGVASLLAAAFGYWASRRYLRDGQGAVETDGDPAQVPVPDGAATPAGPEPPVRALDVAGLPPGPSVGEPSRAGSG